MGPPGDPDRRETLCLRSSRARLPRRRPSGAPRSLTPARGRCYIHYGNAPAVCAVALCAAAVPPGAFPPTTIPRVSSRTTAERARTLGARSPDRARHATSGEVAPGAQSAAGECREGVRKATVPIYEFKCANCAHQFEALCRMGSNGRGMACPSCSSKRLRRMMSSFAMRSGGSRSPSASAGGGGSSCAGCSSRNCSTCH